jgi:GNAT superfamily N-acetyltransferase
MQLRPARPDEADWINARYADVRFRGSDLTRELVIVAEVDGVRAGIGRLVPAGEDACELGGMLVFEEFRGRGLARALIEELLRHAAGRTVYCVPFADLEPIYAGEGFTAIEPAAGLPEYVGQKLAWCAAEIDRPVILMVLRP